MQVKGENLMYLSNKAELKRVWVDALRSGKYRQGQNTLHNTDSGSFCCLGVAAAVWGISTPETMGVQEDRYGTPATEGPTEIYQELRFVMPTEIVDTGIDMNDGGKSFAEIADMIERDWDV